MIEEIYNKYVSKYPDAFYGWYFTPEMSNGPLVKLSSPFIAKGVNVIIDAIERTDADAPLLLSPFFSQYGANPGIESAKLFWASFIKSVNFREHDIFCPHYRHNHSARYREHAGCDRDARQARQTDGHSLALC